MIDFNINDYVKVKLTPLGIKILKEKHDRLNEFVNGTLGDFTLKLDSDGYYRDQLWEIMKIFGWCMMMGSDIPFETVIKIESGDRP